MLILTVCSISVTRLLSAASKAQLDRVFKYLQLQVQNPGKTASKFESLVLFMKLQTVWYLYIKYSN